MPNYSNREFVLAEVNLHGWVLQYIHTDLKKDREIVLVAVARFGLGLQFAHDDLKKDWQVVLAAVRGNESALCFAHEDLKNDEEFLWEVDQLHKIKVNSDIFTYISKRIQCKISLNPDYLSDFSPVYLKPCKR
jgi:hypothetical protein